MKIVDDLPSALSALDRPNSYIGRSVPRPNLARLTQGRGVYVSIKSNGHSQRGAN